MCFFILSFDFKVNKHFYPKTFREEKMSASNKALPLFQWESFIPKYTGSILQINKYSLVKMTRQEY